MEAGMTWRKSSYSSNGGECVEVGTTWRKSRSQAQGNCVETASDSGTVLVRDTTDTGGPMLNFPAAAWGKFVNGL